MGHMKDLDRRIRQGGDDAIAAVGELLPRWIPVLDKWPHDGDWVLVSRLGGRLVCEAQHKGKGIFMRGASEVHPTHWMPLPEPPEVT